MNKEKGFRAHVHVYDKICYVDTFTGEGFDKVLNLIDPMISKAASKTHLNNMTYEDIKSEFTILILEGIRGFNPERGVKLSTFLQQHLYNKRVSKICSDNLLSHDAYLYHDSEGDAAASQGRRVSRNEVRFCSIAKNNADGDERIHFQNTLSESASIYPSSKKNIETIDFENSLSKIISKLDPKTKRIIELLYYEGLNYTDIAKEVELTPWMVSLRLKDLSRKGTFKSIFGLEEERLTRKDLFNDSKLEEGPDYGFEK